MPKTAWKKSLGTSKREQGISTPKAPQNRPPEVFKSTASSHGPVLNPFEAIMAFFKDTAKTVFKFKRKRVDYIKPTFIDKTSRSRMKTFHRLQSQKGK